METVVWLVIIAILFIVYASYNIRSRVIERQKNIDLLLSVTSLSRGTPSERQLIISLLKYGINSGAIFHDLYIYKPDGNTTQIDLVIATRVGIIVFEVKDYSGWIYGKGDQQKWTQVLSYGREKYRFYNPILQNKSHITQLKRILKEKVPFYSVIVFYGSCELQDVSFIPQNTYVTKSHRVIDVVKMILQENSIAEYKNKHHVIDILKKSVANGNNYEVEKKHISNIRDMLGSDRIFK